MSTEPAIPTLNDHCGFAADAGLSQYGGVTLGKLAAGLNWSGGADAQELAATPWGYQESSQELPQKSSQSNSEPLPPIPTPESIVNDNAFDEPEEFTETITDSVSIDDSDVGTATDEPSIVDLIEDSLLEDSLTRSDTPKIEPTETDPVVIEMIESEPPKLVDLPTVDPPAVKSVATPVLKVAATSSPRSPARSTSFANANMTSIVRPMNHQRAAVSGDDYLSQLEQLVVELNLELCTPPTNEQAGSSEAQLQLLTQRLVNLSLENLQLRRQLAASNKSAPTESAAN